MRRPPSTLHAVQRAALHLACIRARLVRIRRRDIALSLGTRCGRRCDCRAIRLARARMGHARRHMHGCTRHDHMWRNFGGQWKLRSGGVGIGAYTPCTPAAGTTVAPLPRPVAAINRVVKAKRHGHHWEVAHGHAPGCLGICLHGRVVLIRGPHGSKRAVRGRYRRTHWHCITRRKYRWGKRRKLNWLGGLCAVAMCVVRRLLGTSHKTRGRWAAIEQMDPSEPCIVVRWYICRWRCCISGITGGAAHGRRRRVLFQLPRFAGTAGCR